MAEDAIDETPLRAGGRLAAATLSSPLLEGAGFRHAFFTRAGGASAPPFDSLNFSVATGDDPAAVAENRARAIRSLGAREGALYYLSQVHGCAHRVLSGEEAFEDVVKAVGDITISSARGVACGVRTADCAPVLLADARSGAVAAVHSGWRGTEQNVVRAAIRALGELVGGELDLCAAVGPHIERCCFEVDEDVAERLALASPAGRRAVWAARDIGTTKPHVDLRVVLRSQLEAAGVRPSRIDDVPGCTVCEPARFFSYRRDGQRGGRLLSAIVARV